MVARLPNLLIFLFGMQILVAIIAGHDQPSFAWVHIGVLFSTLLYFAAAVFGVPKLAELPRFEGEKLFSGSIFPFLQVVAADFWLAAKIFHLPDPMIFIALIFGFSCLALL